MDTARLGTLEQVRQFLASVSDVQLRVLQDEGERRRFVERTLRWFGYPRRPRPERGVLFAYLQRVSGYSRAHVIRLIAQYRDHGTLAVRERGVRTRFARHYTAEDVALLAELDSLHDTLSGAVTRVLAQRAWGLYGDVRYERLAHISVSHLYNLRASQGYRQRRRTWSKTRPSPVAIAVKKAPAPGGLLGYIRIDTVHQGDEDGVKGVYHVNAVDIVTQWEVVAAVERISEAYLNFHRPCYFAVDKLEARGRIRKTYPIDQIMTPCQRLRSIPDFEQYLKPGVTAQSLNQTAPAMTDTQAAQALQDMRRNLFAAIRRKRA